MQKQNEMAVTNLTKQVNDMQAYIHEKQNEHEDFVKNEFKQSVSINKECIELLKDVKGMLGEHRAMFDIMIRKLDSKDF